jgi:hypothetical protein
MNNRVELRREAFHRFMEQIREIDHEYTQTKDGPKMTYLKTLAHEEYHAALAEIDLAFGKGDDNTWCSFSDQKHPE